MKYWRQPQHIRKGKQAGVNRATLKISSRISFEMKTHLFNLKKKKIRFCPKHNVPLKGKPILWGMPDPSADLSKYIIGGCLVMDDSPNYGYKCPMGGEIYVKKIDSNI